MEIKIKAIHFDASAKLESFINRKIERLARRNEEITKVDVTLKVIKPESAMKPSTLPSMHSSINSTRPRKTNDEWGGVPRQAPAMT